jgi:tetratricopeptide (TPR) repeat protein
MLSFIGFEQHPERHCLQVYVYIPFSVVVGFILLYRLIERQQLPVPRGLLHLMEAAMKTETIFAGILIIAIFLSGCADKSMKYYNLGIAAAEREEYDTAIEYWRESLKHRSNDPEARYNVGMALLKLERYAEAEIEFSKALEYADNDHEVLYGLGKSLEMQGRLTDAKKYYDRSINLKPNFAPSHLGLASISLKMDQYRSAENHATTVLRLEPSNLEGNILLSDALFHQSNYQEAYAQLQSAKNLDPLDSELHLMLGKVAYARHMYRDAYASLAKARSLGASNSDVYLYLGLTLLNLDNIEDSESNLKLALFKDDKEIKAWQALGRIYTKKKEWSKALDAFGKALELDPEDKVSILGVSFVMMNSGRFDEAISRLERLQSNPDPPPMTFYYLGHAYLRASMLEKAAQTFRTFIEVWDGDVRLLEEASGIVDSLGN